MGLIYFNDISEYVKHGRTQNSTEFLPTTYTDAPLEKYQSITTQISKKFAQFGRVTIVAGLAIVSAPIAIASATVAAPLATLYMFDRDLKSDIKNYIIDPERCNFTGFLKKTGVVVLFAIVVCFITFGILSADLTLLLATYLTHSNRMQIWNTIINNN